MCSGLKLATLILPYGKVNAEMTHRVTALLIGQPGSLRDGLQVLLKSVSQIEAVIHTNDISTALAVDLDHLVSLIFIVKNATNEKLSTSLSQIKNKWTQARIVILVDDEVQRQELQEPYCDLVLIKGFPATNLITIIEKLLSQKIDSIEH